jgi:SAM-dependent methyltransferase
MVKPATPQEAKWLGEHGKTYSKGWVLEPPALDKLWRERVTGGVSRTEIIEEMLAGIPKDILILEVGCNVGNQLVLLEKLGYPHAYGVELIPEAVETAKCRLGYKVIQGSALQLPFPDKSFDLVMTCWCLSHIAPNDVQKAANEMRRVTKRWVFCTENYAPKERCVTKDYLWQRNHLELFPTYTDRGVIPLSVVKTLKHRVYPPAKPHPAAPSHKKGCTDAFLLEIL